MSNIIEEVRNKIGMSRKDMAEHLNITDGAISNYEHGTRFPKPDVAYGIKDLAASHGISITLEDIYPRPKKRH
jgi:DNA-binding XRE family transcriptional regulator